jgi:hypothetical protein
LLSQITWDRASVIHRQSLAGRSQNNVLLKNYVKTVIQYWPDHQPSGEMLTSNLMV